MQIVRFGQVVVRAGIQTPDPLRDLIAGRQDQHRRLLPGATLLAQPVDTIAVGQSQILQNEGRTPPRPRRRWPSSRCPTTSTACE
jgi:hypothetical protein